MASRKPTATTTLTKFPVKQRKELGDNLARVDCKILLVRPLTKIVTDGHTDSLTNLIKCEVVCRSYSYASGQRHYGLLIVTIVIN